MTNPEPKLTPTGDLIVEVLAARHRLGEHVWPFSTTTRAAAERLAAEGLVSVLHGNVEGTYRASLTDAGRAYALSPTYAPPSRATSEATRARSTDPEAVRELRGRLRVLLTEAASIEGVLAAVDGPRPTTS